MPSGQARRSGATRNRAASHYLLGVPLVVIAVVVGAVAALVSGRLVSPTAGPRRHIGPWHIGRWHIGPWHIGPWRLAPPSVPCSGPDRIDAVLLWAGAVLSLLGHWVTSGPASAVTAAAGYGLLGGYAWRRRALPGMLLVAVGLVSNVTVIALDGGMPVEGLGPGASSGLHHALTRADHLASLADVISIPALGAIVSPGDVVLSVGAVLTAYCWVGSRRRRVGGTAG